MLYDKYYVVAHMVCGLVVCNVFCRLHGRPKMAVVLQNQPKRDSTERETTATITPYTIVGIVSWEYIRILVYGVWLLQHLRKQIKISHTRDERRIQHIFSCAPSVSLYETTKNIPTTKH